MAAVQRAARQQRLQARARRVVQLVLLANAGQAQTANGQAGSLDPLLGALGSREYPVDLEALQVLNLRMGERTIPIAMQPVNITGTDNSLIFRLLPRVGSPR